MLQIIFDTIKMCLNQHLKLKYVWLIIVLIHCNIKDNFIIVKIVKILFFKLISGIIGRASLSTSFCNTYPKSTLQTKKDNVWLIIVLIHYNINNNQKDFKDFVFQIFFQVLLYELLSQHPPAIHIQNQHCRKKRTMFGL